MMNSFSQVTLWVAFLLGLSQTTGAQQLGVGIHPNQDLAIIENALVTSGMSFRMDIHWSAVEKQKGVLQLPAEYGRFETLAADVAQRSASALLVLDYGNQFYGGGTTGGELPTSTDAMRGFANYAKFMVDRFKGSVSQFEVYNEWNLNISSKQQPHVWGNAAAYVDLLRAAYPAIKSANPNAVVIGGVVGGTDSNWVTRFIRAGGLNYVDALSVHPYVYKHGAKPKAPSWIKLSWIPSADAAASGAVPGTPEEAMAWIDQVKNQIEQAMPGRNIPIYVTEIGWPTNTSAYGVSESVAAAYVQRFMLLAHSRAWLRGVWWYELIDEGIDQMSTEARFGLMRQNGQPKPAWKSLQQLNGLIQSKSASTQKSGSQGAIIVTGKSSNETNFSAIWLPVDDFAVAETSDELKALLESGYTALGSGGTAAISAVPIVLGR